MKLLIFLVTMPFVLILIGCSSTENINKDIRPGLETVRPQGSITDYREYYPTLGDYLRQVPGVLITGSEQNQMVTIRGVSSFNLGNEPLFVIDGHIAGNTYNQVSRMINVRDIDHVRVLKGSEASIYGIRGGNGVILISTK